MSKQSVSKSLFFRLDSSYHNRKEYDKTNNILPNSQSTSVICSQTDEPETTNNERNNDVTINKNNITIDVINSNNNGNKTSTFHNTSSENNNLGNNNKNDKNNMPNQCHKCGRIVKSVGGLKLHIRSYKGAVQSYTSGMLKTTENKNLTQITVSPI